MTGFRRTTTEVNSAIRRNAIARGAISVELVPGPNGEAGMFLERYNGGVWKALVLGDLYEFDHPDQARSFIAAAHPILAEAMRTAEASVAALYEEAKR